MNEFDMLGGFDSSQIAPNTGGGGSLPVSPPEGHLVMITEHEAKANSDPQSGSHIALSLRVTAGPNEGSTGVHRLNLAHKTSDQAVKIARGELSAICHCVGHIGPLPNGIADLYNRPFRVIVEYQKGKDAIEKGYTEIKRFLDQNGKKPGSGGVGGTPAPAPAPATSPAAAAPVAAQPAPAPQAAPAGQFPVDTGVAPQPAPAAAQPAPVAAQPQPAVQPVAAQPQPAPAPAPTQPQPAAGGATPPWQG